MHKTPKIPSLTRRVGTSVIMGVAIASMGIAVEVAINGGSPRVTAAADDVVIGIAAALVVFFYEQRRHRAILEKVRVIAGMNHHVRNALQALAYVPYTEQEKQIKMVKESVQRIEWALREILPGEPAEEDGKEVFQRPASVPKNGAPSN
jgi:hypothetical protein